MNISRIRNQTSKKSGGSNTPDHDPPSTRIRAEQQTASLRKSSVTRDSKRKRETTIESDEYQIPQSKKCKKSSRPQSKSSNNINISPKKLKVTTKSSNTEEVASSQTSENSVTEFRTISSSSQNEHASESRQRTSIKRRASSNSLEEPRAKKHKPRFERLQLLNLINHGPRN
eukprot:535203_1